LVRRTVIFCGLSILLLVGIGFDKSRWPKPADVDPYHNEVRMAVEAVPIEIDEEWTGSEMELQRAAVQLLRPNVTLSRRYESSVSGESFHLMVIHCRDTRDMIGHYPPVCYPQSGWTQQSRRVLDVGLLGRTVPITEYQFSQPLSGAASNITVYNAIVLPNGTFGLSNADIDYIGANRQARVFGSAQLQMVFSSMIPADRRQEIVEQFMGHLSSPLNRILGGMDGSW